ncbi:MAG: hypothetical protein J6Y16_09600 [Treponema sp.]|nr:hypothetical protein [Treponema sp.]
MSLTEFDEEEFKRVCYEDGRVEGASQKAIEAAENLLREGIPVDTISRCIGLSLEQVQEIAERLAVKA